MMKTFVGILAGFAIIPTMIAVCGLWVWLMTKFNISKADFSIGAGLAMACVVISFLVVRSRL